MVGSRKEGVVTVGIRDYGGEKNSGIRKREDEMHGAGSTEYRFGRMEGGREGGKE